MKEKGEREGERREKGRKEKKGERKGKEEKKGERKGEEERKRCKCFFFLLVSDSNDTILTNLASSTDEKVKY